LYITGGSGAAQARDRGEPAPTAPRGGETAREETPGGGATQGNGTPCREISCYGDNILVMSSNSVLLLELIRSLSVASIKLIVYKFKFKPVATS